jgi:hypothetical protein
MQAGYRVDQNFAALAMAEIRLHISIPDWTRFRHGLAAHPSHSDKSTHVLSVNHVGLTSDQARFRSP